MKLPRKLPSPAMIVSVAALAVALGGTSYAAVKINGQDIQRDTITAKQIKKGSLGSQVIRDGSLRAKDFAGNLPAGEDGEVGPEGAPGAPGEQGPAGVGRWALIDETGAIVAQSGGFSVTAPYPVLPNTAVDPAPSNALRANGNVYIDAGEDLAGNGILTTLVLENTVDKDGDGVTNGRAAGSDKNPEFSGEITASRCSFTGASPAIPTNCAPPGTATPTTFVVSPRNSDGSFTVDGARKAFYVVITGDSSDLPG